MSPVDHPDCLHLFWTSEDNRSTTRKPALNNCCRYIVKNTAYTRTPIIKYIENNTIANLQCATYSWCVRLSLFQYKNEWNTVPRISIQDWVTLPIPEVRRKEIISHNIKIPPKVERKSSSFPWRRKWSRFVQTPKLYNGTKMENDCREDAKGWEIFTTVIGLDKVS